MIDPNDKVKHIVEGHLTLILDQTDSSKLYLLISENDTYINLKSLGKHLKIPMDRISYSFPTLSGDFALPNKPS